MSRPRRWKPATSLNVVGDPLGPPVVCRLGRALISTFYHTLVSVLHVFYWFVSVLDPPWRVPTAGQSTKYSWRVRVCSSHVWRKLERVLWPGLKIDPVFV